MSPIEIGKKAPAFSLKDQHGNSHTLSQYKGTPVVLFFYPKDNTPGCTVQATDFTAMAADFAKIGMKVVGLSADDTASHQKFCTKHNLKIDLLSDPSKKFIESVGSMGPKMFGKLGILRTTFIINPKGVLEKVYKRVRAAGHAEKVLAEWTEKTSDAA